MLQESATDTAALFVLIIHLYTIPLAAVPWCSQNVPILLCQQSTLAVMRSNLCCLYISGHFLSSTVLFLQYSCSRINPDTEQRSSEETKLASYATPSSERGSITRGLILRVTKERKNETRQEQKQKPLEDT